MLADSLGPFRGNFGDIPNSMELDTPMPSDVAARLRRGYFASVSYTDDNIGQVLAAAAPILNRTVVVMIGDHGKVVPHMSARIVTSLHV